MKHILVIDDDANIRLILQRLLEKQGYSVDCAEDGSIGLTALVRQEGRGKNRTWEWRRDVVWRTGSKVLPLPALAPKRYK